MSSTPFHDEGQEPVSAARAVALFLGEGVDQDDPVSLLGLEGEGPWTEPQVVVALQARLRVIGEHPNRSAPQADELRMSLHAAASRLLTSPRSTDFSPSAAGMPADLRGQVAAAVAAGGGWSRDVMRQVMAMAAERGIDQRTLASWLSDLQPAGGSTGATAVPRPRAARPSVLDPDPASIDPASIDPARGVVVLIGWLLGGLLSLLGVAAVIVVVVSMRPPPGATPAPSTSGAVVAGSDRIDVAVAPADTVAVAATPADAGPSTKAAAPTVPSTAAAPSHVQEWPDLVRDVEVATRTIRSKDRSGVEAFSRAYGRLAEAWPGATSDERIRAVDAVIDAVYAGASLAQGEPGVLDAIIAHSLEGANPPSGPHMIGSVWTAGVAARLARERDLPQGMVRQVERLVSSFFGPGGVGEPTFDHGVSAWLRAVGGRLVTRDVSSDPAIVDARVEAWAKWLVAAKASQAVPPTAIVLGAMDRLMTAGPEPSRDEATFRILTELACAVPWRAEDPSRAWLLAKFDQSAVGTDDLHVLTRALATRSGAPGVDVTMVLRADARDDERARVRAQYASAWAGRAPPSKVKTHQAWLAAATRELELPRADSVLGRAVRAVAMARLNQGGQLLAAAGLDESRAVAAAGEVDLLLIDLDAGLEKRVAALAAATRPSALRRESTAWAVQYVAAQQRIAERLQLLADFSETPTLMEARILVEAAFRASPERVQAEAQGMLKRRGAQVTVAAALLEFAPFIPATAKSADLVKAVTGVDALPSPRHSSWPVAVRRALVERTLELLAGDGVDAVADAMGAAMADAYAGRLTSTGGTPQTMPAEEAVERVTAAAIREAQSLVPTGREPLGLSMILRNKEARERLAAGRVQLFAARQATLAELSAYAACCEFPDRVERLADLLAASIEERRRAVHVLDQIAASERLMLEVWVMRLDDTRQEGAS